MGNDGGNSAKGSPGIIRRVKNKINSEKKKALKHFRVLKKEISQNKLVKDLEKAGINRGDTLMVHASLSRIGNVNGGAATVIAALLERIGDKGNLVMPAFSYVSSMANTARADNYVFDPLSTPCVVGKIPEEFRKMPDVKRSIHPTHSISARGPHSIEITEGHLNAETNFGKNTPFHKIRELKGKIVGLGISIGPVTIYHTVEDFYPELYGNVYLSKPEPIKVLVNGKETTKSVFIHNPEFHAVRIDKDEIIEKWMTKHLKEKGILHESTFGSGNIWWMDIQDLFDELIALKKNGISIYKVPESNV